MRLLVVPSGISRNVGDLLVSQVVEEGEAQGLSLRWRQRSDGLADNRLAMLAPGFLRWAGTGLGNTIRAQSFRVRHDLDPPPAPTQLVDHAEVGDPQDPGAKGAARWVKSTGLAPDRHEDVLNDLFSGGGAERLGCHVVDQ